LVPHYFDELDLNAGARSTASVYFLLIPTILTIIFSTWQALDGIRMREFVIDDEKIVYIKGNKNVQILVQDLIEIRFQLDQVFGTYGGSISKILKFTPVDGKPIKVVKEVILKARHPRFDKFVLNVQNFSKERGITFRMDVTGTNYSDADKTARLDSIFHGRKGSFRDWKKKLRRLQVLLLLLYASTIMMMILLGVTGALTIPGIIILGLIILVGITCLPGFLLLGHWLNDRPTRVEDQLGMD
jgi:hypothetical protein